MLIPLIPTAFHDFTGVRFVFLYSRIGQQTDVVVNIKVEQWARFSSRFVDNKVIEGVMLVGFGQLSLPCQRIECVHEAR